MATVGTMLQSLERECGDRPPDPVLSLDWLQNRLGTLQERAPYTFLLTEATFQTVAEVTAGTVTLTNNSATVTESVSNANGWSSALENRYFRVDGRSEFYKISTFTNSNPDTLTLSRVYEGSTATLTGYSVFQRIYTLATDVREVLSLTRLNTAATMSEASQTELDAAFPDRGDLGEPAIWAPAGRDSSDVYLLELYPIPDTAVGIMYRYFARTATLTGAGSVINAQADYRTLRAGWLADYWKWVAAHKDAEVGSCLALYNSFEVEFERRLAEIILREAQSIAPQKMKLHPSITRHRWTRANKFGSTDTTVVIES